MEIKYDNDIWVVSCKDKSLGNNHTFNFSHIKKLTLKNQFKDYFLFQIKHDYIKVISLNRYCYSLYRFTEFLKESDLAMDYLSDLSGDIIDRFILYLKSTCRSTSTMVLSYTALKQSVRFGQNLGLKFYPDREIFPVDTTRIFGYEDTLKTRLFGDDVVTKIVNALDNEKNIYLKTAIMVAHETGLRLSEILNLKSDCIYEDFAKTPVLFTYSSKADVERCVPITDKCANQIKLLDKHTKGFSAENYIFTTKNHQIYQTSIRNSLKRFLLKNNITNQNGDIEYVLFHGFRHFVGTTYLNSGASADETRQMLGHKSLHSTNLYVKLKPKTLREAYKKIGFIGIIEDDLNENTQGCEVIIDKEIIVEGTLPDGICLKAFEGAHHCDRFNVCLLCNKYRTTIDDLQTHNKHLLRIKDDKERYMTEMSISNIEYVNRIERALETIIERLEAIIIEQSN